MGLIHTPAIHGFTKFGHRARGYEPAMIHDAYSIAQLLGFFQVVGGEDHGGPPIAEIAEAGEDRFTRLDIDSHGWLVEKEQCGLVEQGAGQVQSPLHSPGKGANPTAAQIRQADERKDLARSLPNQGGWESVQTAEEAQVLLGGKVFEEGQLLGNQTEVTSVAEWVLAFAPSGDLDEATRPGPIANNGGDGAALPGTVRSEKTEDFARGNAQAQILDSGKITVLDRQMLKRKNDHASSSSPCSSGRKYP